MKRYFIPFAFSILCLLGSLMIHSKENLDSHVAQQQKEKENQVVGRSMHRSITDLFFQ